MKIETKFDVGDYVYVIRLNASMGRKREWYVDDELFRVYAIKTDTELSYQSTDFVVTNNIDFDNFVEPYIFLHPMEDECFSTFKEAQAECGRRNSEMEQDR